MASGGTKYDGEKVRLDLLSSFWVQSVGAVLTFGAKKYAAHNWRKGIGISRLIAASLRHLFAFLGGENNDPETNLPHLAHASCCLMFASELMVTRPDLDDRYKEKRMNKIMAVLLRMFETADGAEKSKKNILTKKRVKKRKRTTKARSKK
jgi:hypothetical protein